MCGAGLPASGCGFGAGASVCCVREVAGGFLLSTLLMVTPKRVAVAFGLGLGAGGGVGPWQKLGFFCLCQGQPSALVARVGPTVS